MFDFKKKISVIISILFCSHLYAAVLFIDINEYQVNGNSLLTETQIYNVFKNYIGKARTVDDINKAAESLQSVYRSQGYPFVYVSIPEQDLAGGIVKFKVTEAKINQSRVTGAKYTLPSRIKEDVSVSGRGKILHFPTLEKQVGELHAKRPNLSVVPIVKPSKVPNKLDVELSLSEKKPYKLTINAHNYHSKVTTPSRLGVNFTYQNLWQKDHAIGFDYQTSPENSKEVDLFKLTYSIPVGDGLDRLMFNYINSDSVLAPTSQISTLSKGKIYSVKYLKRLQPGNNSIKSLNLGIELNDDNEDLFSDSELSQVTPIKYWKLIAGFNRSFSTEDVANNFALNIAAGIRGGLNDEVEFRVKQSEALSNFLKINIDISRSKSLANDLIFTSQLRIQLADTPLISAEQLSVGGMGTVRGYYDSQITGDSGYIANLEITGPEYFKSTSWVDGARLTLFLEQARSFKRKASAGEQSAVNIAAIGLGWEALFWEKLRFRMDHAFALQDSDEISAGDFRSRVNVILNL